MSLRIIHFVIAICLLVTATPAAGKKGRGGKPKPPPAAPNPVFAYTSPGDIMLMDYDGGNETLVAASVGGYGLNPSWSPDGNSIVYVTGTATNQDAMWRADVDGPDKGNSRMLWQIEPLLRANSGWAPWVAIPQFDDAPGGESCSVSTGSAIERIVYSAGPVDEDPDLYLAPPDGGKPEQLPGAPVVTDTPSFSTVNGRLVMTVAGTANVINLHELRACTVTGGAPRFELRNLGGIGLTGMLDGRSVNSVDLHPANPNLLALGLDEVQLGKYGAYALDLGSETLTSLATGVKGKGSTYRPRWSPDGTEIVFWQSGSIGRPTIYRVNAGGAGTTKLGAGVNPEWRPTWRAAADGN